MSAHSRKISKTRASSGLYIYVRPLKSISNFRCTGDRMFVYYQMQRVGDASGTVYEHEADYC